MKILCVSLNHYPEQTGIGKFQGEMVAWLTSRSHDVRVITGPPYYPEWKVAHGYSAWRYMREKIAGALVFRVPLYVPSAPGGLKRLLHLGSFALTAFPVILWQALAWRPDVILTTAPPLSVAPIVLLASRVSGARSQLHMLDFEVDAAFQLGILERPTLRRVALGVERSLLCSFTKVSTISRRMRERLIAKGVQVERTVLIPNWANVESIDPESGPGEWRERLNADAGTILAVYAGNMGSKQGLETIVEAARLLRDRPCIRFIVCGDGAGRGSLVASAAGLQNVTFLPLQPLDEFSHLLTAADIHLLPQRAEAADLVMPSKLGNILASGRPVVAGAAANTQVYDAVQGCGMAVEPDNAVEFANAIATLAEDAELRTRMGEVARRRALAEWNRDSNLEEMEASLKGGSRAASPV
jgi:colanic acid biosynthesis glycosyl transferase WcaI